MEQKKELTRAEAITNIFESVAKEEEAIAKILRSIDDKYYKEKDDEDIKLINALTRLQFFITAKLYVFLNCACPEKDKDKPWPL